MTAIDMKTRQIAWQVPLGTVEDTGPLGIKMGLKAPIGMPTIGGPMATQGGLVFFAATQDYYLRAFDSSTGKELWKSRMPVGSQELQLAMFHLKQVNNMWLLPQVEHDSLRTMVIM